MKSIAVAQSLRSAGRFREALEAIPFADDRRDSLVTRLLRAELLAEVGDAGRSASIIETIETPRSVSESERSQIEFIKAVIEKEKGNFDAELHHLQRSISFAERAHDLERMCLAQLSLVALVADRSGPETVSALLSTARTNVIKLGNPSVSAALHMVAGDLDGKRSLLATASRHNELAGKLLQTTSHRWFEAWSQIGAVAISILQGEFERALTQGADALRTNLDCGTRRGIRSSLGNLGHVHLMRGEFERALGYFNQVVEHGALSNEQVLSARENIAQVHLARGSFEHCLQFLDQPHIDMGYSPELKCCFGLEDGPTRSHARSISKLWHVKLTMKHFWRVRGY
jgi:tetratricopeptide (TPR) repeat protein